MALRLFVVDNDFRCLCAALRKLPEECQSERKQKVKKMKAFKQTEKKESKDGEKRERKCDVNEGYLRLRLPT